VVVVEAVEQLVAAAARLDLPQLQPLVVCSLLLQPLLE
jgi:hypothetical protein